LPIQEQADERRPEWEIPSGVFIVTLRTPTRVNAYAAGWVVRVSEEPVMIQVAVWDQNYSHELTEDCDHFVVQVLQEGQESVARHFGRNSGRDMDKLAGFKTHPGVSGVPILDDCLAYLECEVVFRQTFGDHKVLVGRAVNSRVQCEGCALVYDYEDYQ